MTANVARAATMAAILVIALGAVAAVAVAARGGEFDDVDWRLVGTLLAALYCGSATLVALRFRPPYNLVAALPLVGFAVVAAAIWFDRLWKDGVETTAKTVVTLLAATLATLLVGSLRLQTPFAGRESTLVYLGASALIVVTTLFAVVLLWSWDVPFLDEPDERGAGGSENVATVAQRALLALFSLSVAAFLATPLLARVLRPRPAGSPR